MLWNANVVRGGLDTLHVAQKPKKGLQMQGFHLKKSGWIEEQRIYDLLSVSLCSVAMCAFHMQMQRVRDRLKGWPWVA